MSVRSLAGVLVIIAGLAAARAGAEEFVVTDNSDSGPGTLRWAIEQGNAKPGKGNRIRFALSTGGGGTIGLEGPLPAITSRVTIDGGSGRVELNGRNWPGTGLRFAPGSAGSEVRGFTVRGFGDFASPLPGIGITIESDSVRILECALLDNATCGVWAAGAWARIEGNRIGLDAAGACAGNGVGVIVATAGAGTAIGGNEIVCSRGDGILLLGVAGCRVSGNWVGLDRAGSEGKGNGGNGISCQGWRDPVTGLLNAAGAVLIGGPEISAGNTISWNGGFGVEIGGAEDSGGEGSPAHGIRISHNRIAANHRVTKDDLRAVSIRPWAKLPPTMDTVLAKPSKDAVTGHAEPGDLIEVYESDSAGFDVADYVGNTKADRNGVWVLRGTKAKAQTVYVASSTGEDGSTSEYASMNGVRPRTPSARPPPPPSERPEVPAPRPIVVDSPQEPRVIETRESTPAVAGTVEEFFLLRLSQRGEAPGKGSLRAPIPPRPIPGPVPLARVSGEEWALEQVEIVSDREGRFERRLLARGGETYGLASVRENGPPSTVLHDEFLATYRSGRGAHREDDLVSLVTVAVGSGSELHGDFHLLKAVWRNR